MKGELRITTSAIYHANRKQSKHEKRRLNEASIMMLTLSVVSPLRFPISSAKMFVSVPGEFDFTSNHPIDL